MFLKKALINTVKLIPPANRYLAEKKDMALKIGEQQKQIGAINKQAQELQNELRFLKGQVPRSIGLDIPVFESDILKAYSKKAVSASVYKKNPPFTINWVLPPMGLLSGGHTNIFQIIAYLESKGHKCRVYFYDALKGQSSTSLRQLMASHYPAIKSEIFYNAKQFKEADIIFASNWFTAYPVFNTDIKARKYYLVQDFESYFDPVGWYSLLAEKTYTFGFRGITLGRWLSKKLSTEYQMKCDYFEFGVNTKEYSLLNRQKRKAVLFYARPFTSRRGFELGISALKLFHEQLPDYKIHLLGWDVSKYQIPFPYINHATLLGSQLNELYNNCAAGLVISFTNMSLLPPELLLAGCIPIVNDAEHTKAVGYQDLIEYAEPSPQALADKMIKTVTDNQLPKRAQHSSVKAKEYDWEKSYKKIEGILTKDLT